MITMTPESRETYPKRFLKSPSSAPTLGLEVLARIDGASEPELDLIPPDVRDLIEADAPLAFIEASN